jgi:hypothetical protein
MGEGGGSGWNPDVLKDRMDKFVGDLDDNSQDFGLSYWYS